eukprot:4592395-Alexandrium_andersonii.AAC.1
MAERMGPDRTDDLWPSLAALAAEALKAGWPQGDVAHVLRAVARRHRSPFFSMVRKLGSTL